MAKTIAAGFTIAAVLALAQVRVDRSESGAQASAIGALRAISSGQSAYAAVNGGYARSLRALGIPCPGSTTGFISPDIRGDPAVRNGYEIRLHASPSATPGRLDCHGDATATAYYATAVPVAPGTGATHAFAVDQLQTIWSDDSGLTPTPPFHETSTIHPLR